LADLAATNSNLVLADMYTKLNGLEEGIIFDNVRLDNRFATGNFYSTDGLNPTPMGSAVIAYYFIEAINEAFGANIPQVIVSDYPGVTLP
jgi:hypothetical protein